MTMNISRDVILDLLPLYLAEEASGDTRALVEAYLETDPQLAETVKTSAAANLPADIPIPLSTEDQMETFKETKRQLLQRTLVLAGIIAVALMSCLGAALMAYFMMVSA